MENKEQRKEVSHKERNSEYQKTSQSDKVFAANVG